MPWLIMLAYNHLLRSAQHTTRSRSLLSPHISVKNTSVLIRMCTSHAINDPATENSAPPPQLTDSSSAPPRQSQKKQKQKNKDKLKKEKSPAEPSKKKEKGPPPEEILHLPLSPYNTSGSATPLDGTTTEERPFNTPILDTHTHLLSTFSAYRETYLDAQYKTLEEFVRAFYGPRPGETSPRVESMVDVWCEAPIRPEWKEIADMPWWGTGQGKIGVDYNFVIGVHPHNSKDYNDEVEAELLRASQHPRFRGIGEIGLDYHYTLSPKDVQQTVFKRQLQLALKINEASKDGIAITIHTREAEEDTERILKEVIPKDYGGSTRGIHVHCFTDTPEFAERLLAHWDNLYIGLTGVITFSTNKSTIDLVKRLDVKNSSEDPSLRILLETDSPYMVPAAISSLPVVKNIKKRFPLSHSGMIPWTAHFVANELNKELPTDNARWDIEKIMNVARQNARSVYGV